MKLNEGIFAAKLYELEQQYGRMQSRLHLCQQEDHKKIRQELQRASDEYKENELLLKSNVESSRSPAVTALADAQLGYFQTAEKILEQELPDYLRSETEPASASQAEAFALYAEYAIDFAVQSVKYALLSALKAIDVQMDVEENSGVILLAATNRPESLDPALTRPGRFDRRVPVELPDLKGREEILKVHAKKIKLAEDVDFEKIARMASGASGAELANIVNEAALRTVRDGRKYVVQADLEESIEVVIAGYQKKNAILTDKEKKIVAYHEIGHALVAAMQSHSAPVQKITIVPRTSGALGYTMQVEEVVFGSITTGASNDIEQATKLSRAMITRYGMDDKFDMVAMESVNNQYLGGDTSLTCSEETQTKIDNQVVELVRKQHQKARRILEDNRQKLDELSAYLYEKETITGEEFMSILHQ